MGLCKCPKRKVTNQFCFEHRVNVCEFCMVNKHPKCVVQSYLQWLQDSDYNPQCELCHQDLSDEPCVRLVCYHVFHWVCLDKYARSLPPHTAPAGYTCPTCQCGLFPPDNLVSPVADALRHLLKDVNWARAGLGMPLLEERVEKRPEFSAPSPPQGPRPAPEGENSHATPAKKEASGVHRSMGDEIVNFDTPTSRNKAGGIDYAALSTSPLLRDPADIDENKYKRKSASEMLFRWAKTFMGPRRRGSKMQRYAMIIGILALAFVTFVVLMSYLSRGGDYTDPMLEPMNNPNIHVGNA